MNKQKILVSLFLLTIVSTACAPSYEVPKINFLQMDSLIVHEPKPKGFTFLCGSSIIIRAYNIEIINLETLNKENITVDAKIIGGKDAIISLLEFPEIAKRARIEGDVVADFDVDKFGNVLEIKIMKGLGGGVDEEVVGCLKKNKFAPAKRNKENDSCKMRIRIRFWPPEGEEDLLDRKEPVKFKSRKL